MHRIYEKRLPSPNGHLQGYFQHKLADCRDDDEGSPRSRRFDPPLPSQQRSGGLKEKTTGSPLASRSKVNGFGNSSFLNVYQKSPATSPQRSLERKNPEKRLARAQNIHQKLAILKSKRLPTEVENTSPNRQGSATRRTSQSPATKGSRGNSVLKQTYNSQARLSKPELSSIRSLYSKTLHSEISPKRNSSKYDLKASVKKIPQNHAKHENSTGRLTPKQSRRTSNEHRPDYSDGSRSQHSDERNSAERSVRSNGLSLTRDNSIERRLYSSMKSRKDASNIAFRLNLNTLFSLDTILWKINTTHHVKDLLL